MHNRAWTLTTERKSLTPEVSHSEEKKSLWCIIHLSKNELEIYRNLLTWAPQKMTKTVLVNKY